MAAVDGIIIGRVRISEADTYGVVVMVKELGQLADLASDWLFTLVQPIRSQLAY